MMGGCSALIIRFFLFVHCTLLSIDCYGIYTEVGLSQSYRRTAFSESMSAESEMISGSISFYFWERTALEFSYTKGLVIQKEQDSAYPIRTISQFSSIYGSDLILSFVDRRSTFQPFIKGGVAYIEKKQVTQDERSPAFETTLDPRFVPSYGVGIKIRLTENFGLSTSLDVWNDSSTTQNDIASRTGITWMF